MRGLDLGWNSVDLPFVDIASELHQDRIEQESRFQMGRIDQIVRGFGMLLQNGTIVRRVIVDQIGDRQDVPVLGHLVDELFDVVVGFVFAEQRIQLMVIGDGIGGVGDFVQLLNGCKMNHVIIRMMGNGQTRFPIFHLPQRFGENGQTHDFIGIAQRKIGQPGFDDHVTFALLLLHGEIVMNRPGTGAENLREPIFSLGQPWQLMIDTPLELTRLIITEELHVVGRQCRGKGEAKA